MEVTKTIDYKKLLTEHQLWPMETWARFDFEHQPPSNPEGIISEAIKKQTDLLRKNVAKERGLYVYYKNGECLYVGKAARLFNRLKSHYYEAQKKVSGDTKNNKWHRFFSSNTGKIVIYWKQVENETDRQIFELALTAVLHPVFEKFH